MTKATTRPRLAGSSIDVLGDMLRRRRVPCICPRQREAVSPVGESQDYRETGGRIVERVRCSGCDRTWTRVNI